WDHGPLASRDRVVQQGRTVVRGAVRTADRRELHAPARSLTARSSGMRILRHLALAMFALCAPSRVHAETVAGGAAELAVTPSLGRGYTPAISSFHDICFDTMPTTRPSFDFDYTFE